MLSIYLSRRASSDFFYIVVEHLLLVSMPNSDVILQFACKSWSCIDFEHNTNVDYLSSDEHAHN